MAKTYSDPVQFTVFGKPQPGAKSWKMMVAAAAREAYDGPPFTGPIWIVMAFAEQRPKEHYETDQNDNTLKLSAPSSPIVKSDLLELSVVVKDALAGILWRDDAQIIISGVQKHYDKSAGVGVTVVELSGAIDDDGGAQPESQTMMEKYDNGG